MYLSINRDESNQVGRLQAGTWMKLKFLLLNSDKTEVVIFRPNHLKKKLLGLNSIKLTFNNKVLLFLPLILWGFFPLH